jgi:1-acyl-sn-glycerol-3-phosphate acyltransferase
MTGILRFLFFLLVVRPLTYIVLGLNVRHFERLPKGGPAILVANHNSHLDTLVLMSLLPLSLLPKLHPVAAADYFLTNAFKSWFSLNILGIIPLKRKPDGDETIDERLTGVYQALERGDVLVLFPEGSRGQPEQLQAFRKGIAYLAQRYPALPVTPIFLHGLGKALPKGEAILVPFFCDVYVGETMTWNGTTEAYMAELNARMDALQAEHKDVPWE